MGLGDSLLLSMNGTPRISCALAIENGGLAMSTQENLRGFTPRMSSCRVILGGLPCLEARTVSNGLRRRVSATRASKSGSVDSPESAASTSASLGPQAQSHLDLLERMTENSTASQAGDDVKTIRDQLASQIEPEAEVVVVSLVSEEKESTPPQLTISQKRNIRRQNYLNKVSERNDAPFFATVAGFVLLPPLLILGFAVATGYIELFP